VSSGVAQIVSAVPALYDYRVWLAIGLIFFVMLINLRGVKESGAFFAVPSYFFIAMMYLMVGVGLFRYFSGSLGMVADPPPLELIHQTQSIGLFLILRAFSSGTSAMTGIEAISDGIMAFREPRSRNAGVTLLVMSAILGSLLLGITFLAGSVGVIPSEAETVISQLARTIYAGRGLVYVLVISSTSLILILAANTAFADFPRLSAILAGDGFLPRQLAYRGSRLVYSRGIMVLAGIAALLVFVFQASVNGLIPLYAIGVFISFTMSQAGMTHRWWKSGHLQPGQEVKERGSTLRFENGWKLKMVINGFGSVCTAVVVVVFAVTKFPDGAWIIIIIVPVLVAVFTYIRNHYRRLAAQLSLEKYGAPPTIVRHRVILPISGVHRGTLAALRYARTLSDDITAVHVSIDPVEAERVQQKWEMWGDGVRLLILESPYRLMLEPLLDYIEEMASKRQGNETITIVVPQFVPEHWWNNALHARTASLLRSVLVHRPGIMITDVPYQVE
jgi:amino acid transporter